MNLHEELITFLDKTRIDSDNIGSVRSRCFVPWDSEWNALVRDETAKREVSRFIPTPEEAERMAQ